MAIDVNIVIATCGRGDLLRRTLSSLSLCHKPVNFHEVIVVENGSKSKAEEIVQSFHSSLNARYMHVEQGNKSNALNSALKMLKNSLIFFTDDDVRLEQHTLCAYAEASMDVQGGKFYGGPVGVDYEKKPPEWLKTYLPRSARGWSLNGDIKTIDQPVFLGCNWAAFVNDLNAIGGFNVNYGPGSLSGTTGQETNMQSCLLNRGLVGVYVPQALVWHYVPENRCSQQWAIKRSYRDGLFEGMMLRIQLHGNLGYPEWVIKQLLKSGFRAVIKSIIAKAPTRFDAQYRFKFYCGYMYGIYHSRKNLCQKTRKDVVTSYKIINIFLISLICFYIASVICIKWQLRSTEIFPFFTWDLFSHIPTSPKTDFAIFVEEIDGRKFDPGLDVMKQKSSFLNVQNATLYTVIQRLGVAITRGNKNEEIFIRNMLESEYFSPFNTRAKYMIVKRKYDPVDKWKTGRSNNEVIKEYHLARLKNQS